MAGSRLRIEGALKLQSKLRIERSVMDLPTYEKDLLRECIEEHMPKLVDWPEHMAQKLLCRRLKFADRFQLTLFMLANHCPPVKYAEWLLKRGMLSDKAARFHVAGIIDAHKTGKLEQEGKTAYVMDATLPDGEAAPIGMRVRTVYTPDFAHNWQYQLYWTEAIYMLNNNTVLPFKVLPNVFEPIEPDICMDIAAIENDALPCTDAPDYGLLTLSLGTE